MVLIESTRREYTFLLSTVSNTKSASEEREAKVEKNTVWRVSRYTRRSVIRWSVNVCVENYDKNVQIIKISNRQIYPEMVL